MKKYMVRNVLAVSISLAMVHALAAPAIIGIATSKGSFRVDDSSVVGNATLFDGAMVETGVTTGELNVLNTKVTLDTGTRTRVHLNHMVLDHGKVQWSGTALRMQAGMLGIVAADGASKAIVLRKGDSVIVGALAGTVNVLAEDGTTLQTIATGLAFDFPQDAGAKAQPATTEDDKDKKKKKKAGAAAAGGAGAAGAAGAAGGGVAAGIGAGAITAIVVGGAAAIAIPAAVIATRDDAPATSR